jgi:predicted nucleic acid-binding protein
MRRIYLDVCCLNRPYDDLSVVRNQLEAEAVLSILRYVRAGQWELASSDVIDAEVSLISDLDRRSRVMSLLESCTVYTKVEPFQIVRARELEAVGFGAFDALHVACAEASGCEALLTTDDRMLSKYRMNARVIMTKVASPLQWMAEVMMS